MATVVETVTDVEDVQYDAVTKTLYVNTAEEAHIKIYNLAGNCVADYYGNSVNLSSLPTNLYIAAISLDNIRVIIKKNKHIILSSHTDSARDRS